MAKTIKMKKIGEILGCWFSKRTDAKAAATWNIPPEIKDDFVPGTKIKWKDLHVDPDLKHDERPVRMVMTVRHDTGGSLFVYDGSKNTFRVQKNQPQIFLGSISQVPLVCEIFTDGKIVQIVFTFPKDMKMLHPEPKPKAAKKKAKPKAECDPDEEKRLPKRWNETKINEQQQRLNDKQRDVTARRRDLDEEQQKLDEQQQSLLHKRVVRRKDYDKTK